MLESEGPAKADVTPMIDALPDDACRYIFFDYNFTTPDKRSLGRTFFVNWTPAKSPIFDKVKYSSNKKNIMNALDGAQVVLQADSKADLSAKEIYDRAIRSL